MSNTLKDKIKDIEREAILKALEECEWIQARAARKLGITERMIGYKINKYGIKIKEAAYGESDVNEVDINNQNINQTNEN
ncbi:MAG: helix-turn-helix domain-containing protein [Nitrospirota bacterium]